MNSGSEPARGDRRSDGRPRRAAGQSKHGAARPAASWTEAPSGRRSRGHPQSGSRPTRSTGSAPRGSADSAGRRGRARGAAGGDQPRGAARGRDDSPPGQRGRSSGRPQRPTRRSATDAATGRAGRGAASGSHAAGSPAVRGPKRTGRDETPRPNRAAHREQRSGSGRPPGARRPTTPGLAPAARRNATAAATEPPVPEHVDVTRLDRAVRAELRSLSKPNADAVTAHLICAGDLLDADPQRALEHARAARRRAGRIGAVREAAGVAAYRAGVWAEALTELRAARRISGDPRILPLIADCERALGRPKQALRALSDPDVARLDAETRAELLIVVAGARRDLGQLDAALSVLARGGLDREHPRPGAARLWYVYADTLQALGRADEAATWFAAAAANDPEGESDAAERAAALL